MRGRMVGIGLCVFMLSQGSAFAGNQETGKDRRTDGVYTSFQSARQYADLFTGAASYALPIDLPPGPGGFTPALGVAYNSDGGNGWLGLGWDLTGLHRIERSAKYGVPTYEVAEGEFSISYDPFEMVLHDARFEILWDQTSQTFLTQPYVPFKISVEKDGYGIAKWTVVDASGVTYVFQGIPAAGRPGYRFYPSAQHAILMVT